MTKFNALSFQITPIINSVKENLEKVHKIINENLYLKPDLIVLPEFFNTGVDHKAFIENAEEGTSSSTISFISYLAKKYKVNIVCGSIIEKENDKYYNTSYVVNRNGEVCGKYRKINLYDCFGGNEDQLVTRGNKIVTVDLDIGKIGLAICFDIRYPMHFYELLKLKAQIFVLPTAFIEINGKDPVLIKENFIALNKVRAMESLAYFISANECGKINSKLFAIGNSCIVNPFGEIISDNLDDKEGVIFATIDTNLVEKLRKDCHFDDKFSTFWK